MHHTAKFSLITLLTLLLAVLNVMLGAVNIPTSHLWQIVTGNALPNDPMAFIVLQSRIPQMVTALLAGASLAASGLMLQTTFRNALAGPSILGITSGASLGVALVMLLFGGTLQAVSTVWSGTMAIIAAAFVGSILIMALLLVLSTWLRNDLMLLITGIMVGYIASALIALLNFSATAEGVQGYVMWGMGTFGSVSLAQLPVFSAVSLLGIAMAMLLIKPLNLIMLGPDYAESLGLNTRRTRSMLLACTGLLVAIITAFCGPISFIGLAVPHIARLLFRTDNHLTLMPATLLLGSLVALLCNLLSVTWSDLVVPINAVTPLIGAPVIIYVIISRSRT